MKKILLVIDMQNDFVDGALGTKEAEKIVPSVVEKVKNFPGEVWFTKDTHTQEYMQSQEGRMLPVPHCIKGTKGWQLIGELDAFCAEHHCPVFEKPSFGSPELARRLREENETVGVECVELVGLCTDICVVSNALMAKACLPEIPIRADASCCAGVTPEKHEAALEVMRSCQVLVENAE